MSPDGWNRYRLGDIFTVARGGSPRPIDAYLTDDPNGINWIKIGDATASGKFIRTTKERIKPEGLSKTRRVIPGDFILSNSMSFGRPYIMAIDGCIHDGWLLLRPNDENSIDREFYFYLLGSDILQQLFSSQAAGSAVRNLNIDLVAAVEVQVPPLHEQRRIAEILSSVDEAIAATRAVIEQTRKVKQGVLERLLTKGIGHTRFKQTEIGEIPEGWEVVELQDVASVRTGLAKNKKEILDAVDLPYLRVANVQDGYVDLSDLQTISVSRGQIERYSLRKGDVLMTEGGDYDKLGRGDVWDGSVEPCLHQNHVFAVRADQERLVPEFLANLTASRSGKAYFQSCSKRSTNLASINSTQVKQFPVRLPDLSEQSEIVRISKSFDAAISVATSRLSQQLQLKSALMSDLLTGRKRVNNALPIAAE
ncbi:restriction endonuclease subunit S [Neorhizobium sp. CSC1952]|uniref:restriction endonuclease subunit S n=1 Tax=Neorhizobium sp. CSC1952 TaxID=2978974 RepID=UPI0025A4DA5A|nr:restriction endonuclease subunit S [Rhizobium sp. CSC1952]WJR68974.1 restriction endonuclease subunit S [Rhizobium sp. CSC1952]